MVKLFKIDQFILLVKLYQPGDIPAFLTSSELIKFAHPFCNQTRVENKGCLAFNQEN